MPLKAEGEFALVEQKLKAVLDLPGQPVKRGTMAHDHDMWMTLADAAAQRGDGTALRQYAPRLEELALRDGHRLYLAIAHRAWGVAHRLQGEYAQAHTRLDQALEIFNTLETRWQAGRTLFELAHVENAQQNVSAASDYLAQSLNLFQAMRATPDVERTRAAMALLKD